MKFAVGSVPPVLALLLLVFGIRPLCAPYASIWVHPSAREYWVEFDERAGGTLRHKWGGAWLLPDYGGEYGQLWRIRPPGVRREFLIFRHCVGAYYAHVVIWHLRSPRDPVLVADLPSVGELRGDSPHELLGLMFQDVDQDGVEELRTADREYVINEEDDELDGWAIRETFHQWTGSTFVPAWFRLEAFGKVGPLLPRRPGTLGSWSFGLHRRRLSGDGECPSPGARRRSPGSRAPCRHGPP